MNKSLTQILVTGLWPEGIEQVLAILSASDVKPLPLSLVELRGFLKKKTGDGVVFCVNHDSPEVLQKINDIKKVNEEIPVFIFSTAQNVEFIVQLMKRGVRDFFLPNFSHAEMIKRISNDVRLYVLTKKIFATEADAFSQNQFEGIIARNKKMQENFQMIAAVAKSNATVLVTGESGTGKELVAKAIHRLSPRASNRLVDINCGAIPKDLLENELFGHEKGSFTGAHKRYTGSFEAAHEGSLFLDEVSEMDVMLQVKLLRVLQERSFSRIGGTEKVNVDVRIIAATNRHLTQLIEQGRFREDLYYRLNVVNIEIPALRERRDDIPLLAKHFLDYYSAKNNKIFMDFSQEAMEALINYDWPGNVRELENTVERLVVLHDTSEVKVKHLPPNIQKVDRAIGYSVDAETTPQETPIIPLEELEKRAIEAAMLKFHGNIGVVAKKLQIGQATLYRKVKKYGFDH